VIYLTATDLIYIGERATGSPLVVRDHGLLESASARPQTRWLGIDSYRTVEAKAAALVHSIVLNHVLVDGNKRLGLAGLIAFLGVNGWRLTWSNDEAFDFITALATGELVDVKQIASTIEEALAPRG
jgi:death-on-curing protein